MERLHKEREIRKFELKGTKKSQRAQLKTLRAEVAGKTQQFIASEDLGGAEKEKLAHLLGVNDELEHELTDMHKQEQELAAAVATAGMEKETKSRDLTRARQRYKRIFEDLKIREIALLDNAKMTSEILQRLREYAQMYDVVKNERNKYVNMIQASTQRAAEMKEKVKILQNEIEILRHEAFTKDKFLARSKFELQNMYAARDALQNDTNKVS